MSDQVTSYCRGCEGYCGVVVTREGSRITAIEGDRKNLLSLGRTCPEAMAQAESLSAPSRITRPMKRQGDRFVEVDWETALSEISASLGQIRASAGARAVGVYAGGQVGMNTNDAVRTGAFAVGMGTPNLFSSLASYGAPFLYAVEQVLGHVAPLQSDVGRAHYILLLGANQRGSQWGPFMGGTMHHEALRHAKETKGSRIVLVDPCKTAMSDVADEVVQIRPGTDVYFLLALVNAILGSVWYDRQYVRDYCQGLDELKDLVAPWTPERVSHICGVDTGVISGVALKFSRSAMSVCHRGLGMLNHQHATVASWALLVLHALTANLLRPGGLYDSAGILDLVPVLKVVPTDKAPRTRVGDFPSLLMQVPGTALADESLTPGDGQLKALVTLSADPAQTLPDAERVQQALGSLDLLVCVGTHQNATTQYADWLLPTAHYWEREDMHVHDTATLPYYFSQHTDAVVAAPAEARSIDHILGELYRRIQPSASGSEWGTLVRLGGRFIAGADDMGSWVQRLWDLLGEADLDEVRAAEHGLNLGDVDRGQWRVTTADERIALVPAALAGAVRELGEPEKSAERPFYLASRSATEDVAGPSPAAPARTVSAVVHPSAAASLGLTAGQAAVAESAHGQVQAVLSLDEGLREDVVVVPGGWGLRIEQSGAMVSVGSLGSGAVDRFTGAPSLAGTPVAIRAASA